MELSIYREAQAAVIGSMLIDPGLAGLVFHRVDASDFSVPELRHVFSSARQLHFRGEPIDTVTVAAQAGEAYADLVSQLRRETPTANNCEPYIELLLNHSKLAQMSELGAALMNAASYEEGLAVLSRAESLLTAGPSRRASSYGEMISEYLDRQQNGKKPDYIDWGIDALNRNLSVSPGRFVILGADSSVGKTALALQLAYNVAKTGKRVGFFSYETSRADVIDRILANTADIHLPRSKAKQLNDTDICRVAAEGCASDNIQLTVIEAAEYDVDDIRAETLSGRYDVIFIDYIQLVPSGGKRDRWQEVTAVSMSMHSMAQRLGVTVVALSQVTPPERNRKGERPPLTKENLRESRQLLNDADVIMLMDLENPALRHGPRILRVDKNKDGPLGQIVLDFDAQHMRFTVRGQGSPKAKARESIPAQVKFEELPNDPEDKCPF